MTADARPLGLLQNGDRRLGAADHRHADVVVKAGAVAVGELLHSVADNLLRVVRENGVEVQLRSLADIVLSSVIDFIFQAAGGEDKAQHVVVEPYHAQVQAVRGMLALHRSPAVDAEGAVAEHSGVGLADHAQRAVAQITDDGNVELLENADKQQRAVHGIDGNAVFVRRLRDILFDFADQRFFHLLHAVAGDHRGAFQSAEQLDDGVNRRRRRDMRIFQ